MKATGGIDRSWRERDMTDIPVHKHAYMYDCCAALAEDPIHHLPLRATMPDRFVLDKADNPHPKMLAAAIEARRRARALGGSETAYYWAGYLDAMCNATGETVEALNAWIDKHTDEASFNGSATRVELRGRKR